VWFGWRGVVIRNISIIYYVFLLFIFINGIHLLLTLRKNKGHAYIKFRRNLLKDTRREVKKKLDDPKASRLLFESGLIIDSITYNSWRYMLLLGFIAGQIIIWVSGGIISPKRVGVAFLIFMFTAPIDEILGRKTVFGYVIALIKQYRKDQIDKEIFETMTQLKNLCIAQAHMPLSGDYLIEQLLKFTKMTKPAYTKLLSLWRLGYEKEACKVFGDMLDTKMSRELSNVLVKLEVMNPAELSEHLELFQNHVREERMTLYLKKQEAISYVLYAPVIASAFMIMLNFMIIVIWMDTMSLIQKL